MNNEPVAWQKLTDDDRIEILNSMPDYMDGFCKTWGWLNFSKATEEKIIEKNSYLISNPVKELTDDDILKVIKRHPFTDGYLNKNLIKFARAILRKASEK